MKIVFKLAVVATLILPISRANAEISSFYISCLEEQTASTDVNSVETCVNIVIDIANNYKNNEAKSDETLNIVLNDLYWLISDNKNMGKHAYLTAEQVEKIQNSIKELLSLSQE